MMTVEEVKARLKKVVMGYPRTIGTEEAMATALLAVLALHKFMEPEESEEDPFCNDCNHLWPCPTVEAITREMSK